MWNILLLNGHEFEQTLGDGEGHGRLACCSPWGRKESDTTEQLNNKILLPPIIWLVCLCLKWKYFYNFIYPHSIRLLRFILDVMCSLTHPFKFLATVHCIYMLNVFIHSPVNRCVFSVCHYQKLRQQNHSSVCIPEYT